MYQALILTFLISGKKIIIYIGLPAGRPIMKILMLVELNQPNYESPQRLSNQEIIDTLCAFITEQMNQSSPSGENIDKTLQLLKNFRIKYYAAEKQLHQLPGINEQEKQEKLDTVYQKIISDLLRLYLDFCLSNSPEQQAILSKIKSVLQDKMSLESSVH